MTWTREENPTIMSGLVVRWKRGGQEISASRDAVYVDAHFASEEGGLDVLHVMLRARTAMRYIRGKEGVRGGFSSWDRKMPTDEELDAMNLADPIHKSPPSAAKDTEAPCPN